MARRCFLIPLLGGVDAAGGRGGQAHPTKPSQAPKSHHNLIQVIGYGGVELAQALTTPSASPPPLLGGEFMGAALLFNSPPWRGGGEADGVVRACASSLRPEPIT